MARPRKKINPQQVTRLARIGCSIDEIATVLDVSRHTLSRRFATEFIKGRENLKMRLRRKQINVALGGNIAMLIWLGKQYLGQSEKQEIVERKIDFTTLSTEELETLAAAESLA